jgi:hypothetical protein
VRLVVPVPRATFRVEITIAPTFRPRELSPQTTSDNRDLGAQVTYAFQAAHK